MHGPDTIHQRWLQLQRSPRSQIRALDKPLAAFQSGAGAGAAGLSDEAIARKLDRGYRTVQRHIGTLMEILSAQTRFQLGLRAAALLNAGDR